MTDEKPNARSVPFLLIDPSSQSDWEFLKSHLSNAVMSSYVSNFESFYCELHATPVANFFFAGDGWAKLSVFY